MKQRKNTTSYKQKKRKIWLIPVVIVLIIILFGFFGIISDSPSRQELASLTIGDIDFSSLNDGTYSGSFVGTKGNQRDSTVEVTILNGKISNIHVVKGAIDEAGTPLDIGNGNTVYDLFDDVLAQKTLQVDVVSGATLTSKSHLKALEDALQQAQTAP